VHEHHTRRPTLFNRSEWFFEPVYSSSLGTTLVHQFTSKNSAREGYSDVKEIDMRRVLIIAVALAITLMAWAVMAKYVTGCYTAICK
jgi:hypothetical protein